MAEFGSLEDVLTSFTTATNAAVKSLPTADLLTPPENGITLLDTKNEIFLAYLQALALRNLNVIRSLKDGSSVDESYRLSNEITKKLTEHRVYLERGVRPLEAKIKYQTDKAVKAADDEERDTVNREAIANRVAKAKNDDEEDGDSDEEESEIDELSYRPNPSAFAQAGDDQDGNAAKRSASKKDGVYRPPRISATAMPTTEAKEKKDRTRPGRSATVDEYINTELSTAPMAMPSIGSTISAGGRGIKDAKQLAKEQERRDYEETNLVRLPKESKKEAAKQKARERSGFGGEEWKGLGESIDRLGDLTRRKGGKASALENSRKRRAVEDGPRDSGIGDAFDLKRRRMLKKMGKR